MLEVHDDAAGDLERLLAIRNNHAVQLFALIEQLGLDEALQDKLLDHGYGRNGTAPIDVSRWHSANRKDDAPLWRLKFWDLEDIGLRFRIIYIFDYTSRTFWVLAVAPRDELDYDDPGNRYRIRALATVRREFGHI
jgi:hypothetical protein